MKYIIVVSMLLLDLLGSTNVHAQTNTDTTVTFKVFGACEQCKQRIEDALHMKGVSAAAWDVDTKMLTATYKPQAVSLNDLHKKVAAVGHDTEIEKAKDNVYRNLPDCCHYREMTMEHSDEMAEHDDHFKGMVVESSNGQDVPLAGATIRWLGTGETVVTNQHGEFMLPKNSGEQKLVISYSGFKTDTVATNGLQDVEIKLNRHEDLVGVVVTARIRTTFIDQNNPFRTAIITKKELLKAACCNLSESFETNPSVDVSYNDAATGSKQIQLLGLAGIYTQLTVENLPGPRGLATALGLNSIAGPWVESIQLIKGAGSVVNGYESIAGQINVELKKPQNSEQLYLNGYVNSTGKTDVNLNLSHQINSKWSTGLLLHDDFLNVKSDENNDGFRDAPTGNQFSGVHRWQYLGDNGLMSEFGVKMMIDRKTGGQMDFDAEDKLTTNSYGLGLHTNRYEAFGKLGYVFPEKMHKSIGLQLSAFDHDQDAFFGLKNYDARQKNFYTNLIYQTQIGSEAHQLKTGASFVYDQYRELLENNSYNRTEAVPGAFVEYTYSPSEKLDVVAGMRADHNSLYGWFATPRFNLRYAPFSKTTVRLSAGRGQRTANIFAENLGLLVSARQWNIMAADVNSKAYGLLPEVAWNKGISVDQKFLVFGRQATAGVDFFRNDFTQQVVLDVEDPATVKVYNLDGKSYSNSLQAEVNVTPLNKLDLRLAYRYFDVKTTYGATTLSKPLTATHRAFANLAYDLAGWKLDYTVNITGAKRLPPTWQNPEAYRFDSYSPAFVTMNAQVSKSFGKKQLFDAYVGAENLTGFRQERAIVAAEQPFSQYFDASMVWGPLTGRMFYAGFRFTVPN
jgi:outer membrane receptor for ferrienterochelin and colicin